MCKKYQNGRKFFFSSQNFVFFSFYVLKNFFKNDDGSFRLPYEAELYSRNNIIVYDGNTSNLYDDGMSDIFL